MQILFISSNRVGDAVLSTGLLDYLLRRHPGARVTVACGPAAEGIFDRMPARARVIVMDKGTQGRSWGRHWLPLWVHSVGRVWDLVVDLRASALSYLVPTRARAVMRRRRGPKIEQIAAMLGLRPAPLPVAWTAPQDRDRAARLLAGSGPVLALGPTANWDGKIWPAAHFVATFARLQAMHPGLRAAVLAGPGERERNLAEPVLHGIPRALDLVGRLSLPEAAACLARSCLFIGNDSGLMHLAAAAGAPTVGLFGPTPADEYAPAGPRSAAAISPSRHMQDLRPEQVCSLAERLIRG